MKNMKIKDMAIRWHGKSGSHDLSIQEACIYSPMTHGCLSHSLDRSSLLLLKAANKHILARHLKTRKEIKRNHTPNGYMQRAALARMQRQ
jgi:hypothetical protein